MRIDMVSVNPGRHSTAYRCATDQRPTGLDSERRSLGQSCVVRKHGPGTIGVP